MKPAHCSNVFGPMPFTCFNCCRLMNGPSFERHSIIFSALEEFRPATLLKINYIQDIPIFLIFINASNNFALYTHIVSKMRFTLGPTGQVPIT